MISSRPHAVRGTIGSVLIHASLFAVLPSLPMSDVPPSRSTAQAADAAVNSLGRGFPGRSNSGAGAYVPGDGADLNANLANLDAPPLESAPATATLGPTAEAIAETLRPVLDYRNWSPARVTRHLVDSTVVVLVMFLLSTLLRRSSARVRYGLWLAASMKFFVPFSALVGLGAAIGIIVPPSADLGRPFASSVFDSVWMSNRIPTTAGSHSLPLAARTAPWLATLVAMWLIGSVTMAVMRYRLWRRVRAALRTSAPLTLPDLDIPPGLDLRSAPSLLEPGVIGWRRPVLLLPNGIVERLKPAELRSVIAHECCHVRRRDNLTAALHMLTEVVFWFHPAVWLIGTRLLAERERACDEAVLAEGHEPATYARAIVNTCAVYVASPVAWVAGVTGSKLTARIEGILQDVRPHPVRGWRKAAVLLTLAGVVVGPIGSGIGRAAPRVQEPATRAASAAVPTDPAPGAPAFEAASIRLNASGLESGDDRIEAGGRYTATNLPLGVFIRFAYTPSGRSRALEPFEVRGGPNWLLSDRFDLTATAGRDVSEAEIRAMLRSLLAERFGVKTHVEQRRGPVFRMSLARPGRLGPQLRRSDVDCAAPTQNAGVPTAAERGCGFFGPAPSVPINSDRAYQALRRITMDQLAVILSAHLGRQVINSTGLSGTFDGDLEFTAEIMMPPPPSGPNPFDGRTLPSIFSVLPDQLGLRLQQTEAPVDTLVIDRASHPTPN